MTKHKPPAQINKPEKAFDAAFKEAVEGATEAKS